MYRCVANYPKALWLKTTTILLLVHIMPIRVVLAPLSLYGLSMWSHQGGARLLTGHIQTHKSTKLELSGLP